MEAAELFRACMSGIQLKIDLPPGPAYRLAITPVTGSTDIIRLAFPIAPAHPEGFAIRCDSEGLTISASDFAGLRWGAQTAAEIISDSTGVVQGFELCDWPHLPIRGVMIDLSRTCVEKPTYIRTLIDFLAGWRCNMLQLYFEERFTLRKHPQLAHPLGYNIGMVSKLSVYAGSRGIELVPAFATFGHAQGYLQAPGHRQLADGDQIYQFDPLNSGTVQLLGDLFDDWTAVAPNGGWVNAGCDEAPYFGNNPRTRAYIEKHGVPAFIAHHLSQIHQMLNARRFSMMIWADMLHHYPETLDLIPRDIVLLEWNYDAIGERTANAIELYRSKGFNVIAAPAASRSAQIGAPLHQQITRNIPEFAALANKLGLAGLLTCQWECQPRSPRLSEPGFALACRLAWQGSTEVEDDVRHAVYSRIIGGDGHTADQIMEAISPDRMMSRFRRIQTDSTMPKSYHLPNHELIATDPLLYLRPESPSPWAESIAKQYETAGRLVCQQSSFAFPEWVQRMDFAAACGRFSAWTRTHMSACGRGFRSAFRHWKEGRVADAKGDLQTALRLLDELIQLCEQLVREAPLHWNEVRYPEDPTYVAVYGARFCEAALGLRQLRDAVNDTLRSLAEGDCFPLADYIHARRALAFHSFQRPGSTINIVSLSLYIPGQDEEWSFHRTVATFQPSDSRYDYIFIPQTLPKRIRLRLMRSQAPWSLHNDLQVKVYRLPSLDSSERTDPTALMTEDYHLIPLANVSYIPLSQISDREAIYELRRS